MANTHLFFGLLIGCLCLAELSCAFTHILGDTNKEVTIRKYKTGTVYHINQKSIGGELNAIWSNQPSRHKRSAYEKPTVTSLFVDSKINARFAQTTITSEMINKGTDNAEANFHVQIPETAFISNFSMLVDGTWLVAEVKEKGEAEKDYTEAQRNNKTAGMVSSSEDYSKPERGMEFFVVAVNVRANASIKFELTYLQLLRRQLGVYEHRLSIRPNQIVLDLKVDVKIYEPQGVKFVDVVEPSAGTNSVTSVISEVAHTSAEVKMVSYYPTVQQQQDMNKTAGINGDLVVRYDTQHPYDAGLIQFEDSYFVHFFSPINTDMVPLRKNVIFVIDISGSMSGTKMEQTRDSMQTILSQLRNIDKFMLILFDDQIEHWPREKALVAAHGDNIMKAKQFANSKLMADGGTNINDPLVEACKILKNSGSIGANIIVFLTDGEPTAGITSQSTIIRNVAEDSAGKVAIFSLGYGYNLNFDLLAAVSYQTGGFAKRIYEGVDAASQLVDFFEEVNTPLAYNIEVVYNVDEVDMDSITKNQFPQYFNGSEIIVTGKMSESAPKTLNAKVKFVTSELMELEKTIDTATPMTIPPTAVQAYQPGFLEKLYVYMKIKDLLLQELITDDAKEKENINKYIIKLALDYNLVTPLTSMIIVQQDRQTDYDRESYSGKNYYSSSPHSNQMTLSSLMGLLLGIHTVKSCLNLHF